MTQENKKIELKRVNINLPTNLVERVKEYGEKIGINTTSAYIFLLNQALDQKNSLEYVPMMIDMYTKMLPYMNNVNKEFEETQNAIIKSTDE